MKLTPPTYLYFVHDALENPSVLEMKMLDLSFRLGPQIFFYSITQATPGMLSRFQAAHLYVQSHIIVHSVSFALSQISGT